MFDEDDLLPLSALQHYLVCPRQCALIHVEQQWAENLQTAEGRDFHRRVDQGGDETRSGARRVFGLALRSLTLGLVGKADVVEFHAQATEPPVPYPIEHKRGRAKADDRDRVQLCAQALCLEEMTGRPVPEGALFYGKTRRRQTVAFDDSLRRLTIATAQAVRALRDEGRTPPPVIVPACAACSLREICLPETCQARRAPVAGYFSRYLDRPDDGG